MPVCLDFRPPTTFLFFLSFPFSFLLSLLLSGGFVLVIFFLSSSLLRFVCLKKVVKYRIFEEIGEEAEIWSRGKVR